MRLLGVSVDENPDIAQLDLSTAFYNGLLNESIFMEISAYSN